jgi:hypothetical protein
MPQRVIHARDLKRVLGGSQRAHRSLVDACLDWCALHRIPAVPISTTGIPVLCADGRVQLHTNERQEGFSDVVICLPPTGRMGLLECKTGNAVRTRAQRDLQRRFEAAGALTLVVRDVQDLPRAIGATRPTHGRDGAYHAAPTIS